MRRALLTNACLAGALVAGTAVAADLDNGVGTAAAAVLDNGGFERSGPAWGRSLEAEWGGDPVAFVGPTEGITPFDGRRMVQFLATSNQGDGRNVSSDLWQVIDLRDLRDEIQSHRVTLSLSAWVNRVSGDRETDTQFAVHIQAFAGNRGAYLLAPESHLDTAASRLATDDLSETWQPLSTSLCLPALTEFVVLRVRAHENVQNDPDGAELDGHFADMVELSVDVANDCVCPADVNADGMIDVDDLLQVARRVGKPGTGDVNRSGMVGFDDVLEVVNAMDGCR